MERLLNLQTALSLGYVGSMIGGAYLCSLYMLPSNCSLKTRLIYLWLSFDCICHLALEGWFVYLSTQSRTVNSCSGLFAYVWQEYAAADARWGTADPTLVSMEWVTVLLAGPLAGYCAWLLRKHDATYHFWVVVLSTAELYGGWMTFAPEWLTGSRALATSDWLLLWVYLVLMNLVWVVVPAWLMVDSYAFVANSLSETKLVDCTLESVQPTPSKTNLEPSTKRVTGMRAISGSAYLLLVAALFVYIMPVGVSATSQQAYDPLGTTTLLPIPSKRTESMLTTLYGVLVPLLLPLGLLGFSFTVGAIQVADKALRKVRKTNRTRRRKLLASIGIDEKVEASSRTLIGFFHPYCNAGGGGERVLYEAVQLHLSLDAQCVVVIYTGDLDSASKTEILEKASSRFGITLDADRIIMVALTRRWMVQDSTWKRFTLLGQSYGSVWLALEALSSLIPDVYIDTMGYAFSYPVARLLARRMPIGAYVHYPIVSTDMLHRVACREAAHTNASVAHSRVRTMLKLYYYRLLARLYSWALKRADVIVANGSWTRAHLEQLTRRKVERVFPPCDTEEMAQFGVERTSRTVVSLAQFRPEKDHAMQLHILKSLLTSHPHWFTSSPAVKLILMGSSRNADDQQRIANLRSLSTSLGLDAHVEFVVNAPFSHILQTLSTASIGLSTMKDEHFGINVVEFMASALITLSHKSAGPWLDIACPSKNHQLPTTPVTRAQPAVGYHAESVDEFAAVLVNIFETQLVDPQQLTHMRSAARLRAQSVFSRHAFIHAWQQCLWSKLQLKLDSQQHHNMKLE